MALTILIAGSNNSVAKLLIEMLKIICLNKNIIIHHKYYPKLYSLDHPSLMIHMIVVEEENREILNIINKFDVVILLDSALSSIMTKYLKEKSSHVITSNTYSPMLSKELDCDVQKDVKKLSKIAENVLIVNVDDENLAKLPRTAREHALATIFLRAIYETKLLPVKRDKFIDALKMMFASDKVVRFCVRMFDKASKLISKM